MQKMNKQMKFDYDSFFKNELHFIYLMKHVYYICVSEINVVSLFFCSFWQCVLIFLYNIRTYIECTISRYRSKIFLLRYFRMKSEYFTSCRSNFTLSFVTYLLCKEKYIKYIKSMTGKYEIKFFLWIIYILA